MPKRAGNEKMNKSSWKRRQKPMRGAFRKVAINPAAVLCRRLLCPGLQKIVSEIFLERQLVRPDCPPNFPILKTPGSWLPTSACGAAQPVPRPFGPAAAFKTSFLGPIPGDQDVAWAAVPKEERWGVGHGRAPSRAGPPVA
jgi:hypothetical protein